MTLKIFLLIFFKKNPKLSIETLRCLLTYSLSSAVRFVAGVKKEFFYSEVCSSFLSLDLEMWFHSFDSGVIYLDDNSPFCKISFIDAFVLYTFWQITGSKSLNNFFYSKYRYPSDCSFIEMKKMIKHEIELFKSESFAFLLPASRELGDDSWVNKYNLWNQLTCEFLLWKFKKDFEARTDEPKPFMQISKDFVVNGPNEEPTSNHWPKAFASERAWKLVEEVKRDFFIKLSNKQALNFEKVYVGKNDTPAISDAEYGILVNEDPENKRKNIFKITVTNFKNLKYKCK